MIYAQPQAEHAISELRVQLKEASNQKLNHLLPKLNSIKDDVSAKGD